MASLDSAQISLRCSFSVRLVFSPSNIPLIKKPYAASVGNVFWLDSPIKFKALNFVGRAGPNQTPIHSLSDDGGGSADDDRRPPFDLNLAVLLAGFAFEAYISPPVSFSAALSSLEFRFITPLGLFFLFCVYFSSLLIGKCWVARGRCS